ncbi:hypothetical protein B0H66DRAFT_604126 [Apodospora peruviana]|uniref:Uncharacterized protein n=1 Tax=Apodospora peruviana TaxID=516989 RepID=A0AAE0I1F4_9PEZI|nr:hypothetical protein B0H66DRAFT_604126 [Apodospora peruviana]
MPEFVVAPAADAAGEQSAAAAAAAVVNAVQVIAGDGVRNQPSSFVQENAGNPVAAVTTSDPIAVAAAGEGSGTVSSRMIMEDLSLGATIAAFNQLRPFTADSTQGTSVASSGTSSAPGPVEAGPSTHLAASSSDMPQAGFSFALPSNAPIMPSVKEVYGQLQAGPISARTRAATAPVEAAAFRLATDDTDADMEIGSIFGMFPELPEQQQPIPGSSSKRKRRGNNKGKDKRCRDDDDDDDDDDEMEDGPSAKTRQPPHLTKGQRKKLRQQQMRNENVDKARKIQVGLNDKLDVVRTSMNAVVDWHREAQVALVRATNELEQNKAKLTVQEEKVRELTARLQAKDAAMDVLREELKRLKGGNDDGAATQQDEGHMVQ